MAVCFFNTDYDNKFTCEYTIGKENIEITVDYDIFDEVPFENGMKVIRGGREYPNRDILIVDYDTKRNILVKEAHYAGHEDVFGTPDDSTKTKFRGHLFFEHSDFNELAQLPQTPKIEKFRVFSKSLLDWIGRPSLTVKKSDDEIEYHLSKLERQQEVVVNANGIRKLSITDDWKARSSDKSCITIDFAGVLEVDLASRVNYDVIYDYFYELVIFMQLYSPDKFEIDEIEVSIGKKLFQLVFPPFDFLHPRKNVERTVDDSLLNFLAKCYVSIPYRRSKQQIRNIPYIVLKTSRGLEDNFLMFYRFIECYYKHAVPEMKNKFISQSIIDHYKHKDQLTELQLENYTQEIISLRNHYAHAGYFIRNSSLRITFEKVDKKANPKNYTATDVDFKWIYERTKILYSIAVDIIFRNMLGYTDYRFTKHF